MKKTTMLIDGAELTFPYMNYGITLSLFGPARTVVSAPGVPDVILPLSPEQAVKALDEKTGYMRDTLCLMRYHGKGKVSGW